MKHTLLALLLIIFCNNIFAQQSDYRNYRARVSIPPYGLAKVKALIKGIKEEENEDRPDGGISRLAPATYDQLSLREKFTYTMIHPEMYGQNCAIFMPQKDEENKIFGYLISWMNEETWSDRQIEFLKENRDSVMAIIKESVDRRKKMGVNYKDAIIETDAWELIPFLINYYNNDKKDKDVLTTLMLLMKNGKFEEFVKSQSYRNLYGMEGNYESSMSYNKANEALTIKRAQNYYKERKADEGEE